jgi:hypothetical protein
VREVRLERQLRDILIQVALQLSTITADRLPGRIVDPRFDRHPAETLGLALVSTEPTKTRTHIGDWEIRDHLFWRRPVALCLCFLQFLLELFELLRAQLFSTLREPVLLRLVQLGRQCSGGLADDTDERLGDIVPDRVSLPAQVRFTHLESRSAQSCADHCSSAA